MNSPPGSSTSSLKGGLRRSLTWLGFPFKTRRPSGVYSVVALSTGKEAEEEEEVMVGEENKRKEVAWGVDEQSSRMSTVEQGSKVGRVAHDRALLREEGGAQLC